jgi:hypothetical protein
MPLPRLLLSALILLAGCVPFAFPPSRTDLGFAAVARGQEGGAGVRLATGVYLASATINPALPLDVGAGYTLTAPLRAPAEGPGGLAQGAYLEGVRHLPLSPLDHAGAGRLQVGGRGAMLFGRGGARPGFELTARLGIEGFKTVNGELETSSDAVAVGFGQLGIGGFVEAGYQALPGTGGSAFIGNVGLSVRLPAIFGIVCCIGLD